MYKQFGKIILKMYIRRRPNRAEYSIIWLSSYLCFPKMFETLSWWIWIIYGYWFGFEIQYLGWIQSIILACDQLYRLQKKKRKKKKTMKYPFRREPHTAIKVFLYPLLARRQWRWWCLTSFCCIKTIFSKVCPSGYLGCIRQNSGRANPQIWVKKQISGQRLRMKSLEGKSLLLMHKRPA